MITQQGDRWLIQGRATIETVPQLFEQGLRQFFQQDCLLDFSQLEAADSAAVSMLLGWQRAAKRASRKLTVTGLPTGLLSLATLYGVEELLPLQLPTS